MNLRNLSKKYDNFYQNKLERTGTNPKELERIQMKYEENMCTETLSEMYANNCKNTHITAQRNALNIYNLSEDDFPDEVILHTGRISKPPEKYEPCESVVESETLDSDTSIISTESECSDADSKGNLDDFVSYSSSDEEPSC